MADLDTADLDAQIAQLEALKSARLAMAESQAHERERQAALILVKGTPTKTKNKPSAIDLPAPPKRPRFGSSSAVARPSSAGSTPASLPPLPPRANFAASLAAKRAVTDDIEIVRTSGQRGEDLTVCADLRLGPGDFGADPEGEQEWRSVEPNSGIRLSKRSMSHADVQDHLYGRYYLPPSKLYAVARLGRDGATYDIPVDTDWVTIAVVAERSDIRISGTKSGGKEAHDDNRDDDIDSLDDSAWSAATSNPKDKSWAKRKGNDKDKPSSTKARVPRKYINLKLVSLPSRSKSLGAKAAGGDAHLQLLLFEAEAVVHNKNGKDRSNRGGSGGAYEKWSNIGVGSVIAILNPRVLRPLQSGAAPHPLTLPLALNPTSDASISVIGHAKDLGRCVALKRDGLRCRTWIDSRREQVCEYHASLALKRTRAGRGELASATTPMESASGASKGKPGFLADRSGGGATYVVGSGKVVRTGEQGARSSPFGDPGALGRKRQRGQNDVAGDDALKRLLERTGDDHSPGARYLRAAQAERSGAAEDMKKEKIKAVIRPHGDHGTTRNEDAAKRAESIAALTTANDRPIKLGRPAGPKRLSNVSIPVAYQSGGALGASAKVLAEEDAEEVMIDLD